MGAFATVDTLAIVPRLVLGKTPLAGPEEIMTSLTYGSDFGQSLKKTFEKRGLAGLMISAASSFVELAAMGVGGLAGAAAGAVGVLFGCSFRASASYGAIKGGKAAKLLLTPFVGAAEIIRCVPLNALNLATCCAGYLGTTAGETLGALVTFLRPSLFESQPEGRMRGWNNKAECY